MAGRGDARGCRHWPSEFGAVQMTGTWTGMSSMALRWLNVAIE
jgi:hypothetical protein